MLGGVFGFVEEGLVGVSFSFDFDVAVLVHGDHEDEGVREVAGLIGDVGKIDHGAADPFER